uniref:G-protein coupled receptors family 1 profile domain-containing protein n=1 Tax=Panagrolaimus davidi TaxID=227884 RepID=A0A914PL12_9BILA
MNLYLGFNVLTGAITSAATFYLLIFWQSINATYNAQILFLLGGISIQALTYAPLIETFLCVDRCLAILFPTKYSTFWKYFIAVFAVFLYILTFLGYNFFTNTINNFPTTIETKCIVFLCQKDRQSQLITVSFKFSTAVINVFGTIILGALMKNRIIATTAIKRINQVVFHMLISTVALVFVPNIAYFIAHLYFFKLADYTGPMGAALTAVNMCACSIIYWKMSRKATKSPVQTLKTQTTSKTFFPN